MLQVIRVLFLLLLCSLVSCRTTLVGGGATAGLQKSAADYYNFRVGNLPGRDYSGFLSPAYRASFNKDDLAALNRGNAPGKSTNKRIETVKAANVVVSVDTNFAMTDVSPQLGFAFESMDPLRWVRVGSRWFLYMGSDHEVSEYGYFPVSIAFPQIPDELPVQVLDEKRRKDTPGGDGAAAGDAESQTGTDSSGD